MPKQKYSLLPLKKEVMEEKRIINRFEKKNKLEKTSYPGFVKIGLRARKVELNIE